MELREIQSGGPRKDGIPAIGQPKFDSVRAARLWLKPREPVIALRVVNEAPAFRLQILIVHAIVNGKINRVPVAITFCPLCNALVIEMVRAFIRQSTAAYLVDTLPSPVS